MPWIVTTNHHFISFQSFKNIKKMANKQAKLLLIRLQNARGNNINDRDFMLMLKPSSSCSLNFFSFQICQNSRPDPLTLQEQQNQEKGSISVKVSLMPSLILSFQLVLQPEFQNEDEMRWYFSHKQRSPVRNPLWNSH